MNSFIILKPVEIPEMFFGNPGNDGQMIKAEGIYRIRMSKYSFGLNEASVRLRTSALNDRGFSTGLSILSISASNISFRKKNL